MPFIKISGLTTATAVSATNQFEINQNGGSRSATVAQVAAFARTSATDPVVLPAGTVSAPALTFTGDTNTGIYSPAADTIAFTEGGVEAMRLDASGNVGIGLSSPAYRIDAVSPAFIGQRLSPSSSTNGIAQAYSNAGGAFQVGIDSSTGGNFGAAYGGFLWHPGAYPISFGTSNTERMRITAAGDVGIGTSSPAKRFVVSDAGAVGMEWSPTDYAGNMRQLAYNRSTTAYVALRTEASQHEFYIGGTERMRITAAGLVGIGTSSPGALCHVNGANFGFRHTNGSVTLDAYADGTNSVCAANSAFFFGTTNSNPTLLVTNNTERMRIDASGNVGIGTTSPGARLQSTAATANYSFRAVSGSSTLDYAEFGSASYLWNSGSTFFTGTATNHPYVLGTNNTERMRIDTSGNVGIGTSSPGARFQSTVNTNNGTIGVAAILDAGSQNPTVAGGGIVMNFRTNSGSSFFGGVGGYTDGTNYVAGLWGGAAASGAPALAVTSAGNVGIGTSSPGNRLTVAGSGQFTGTIGQNSTGTHIWYQSDLSYLGAWGPNSSTNGTLVFYSARSDGSNGLERARITSGGNFLVGKTAADNTTAGANLQGDGFVAFSRNGNVIQIINRNTNDGDLVGFWQDGVGEGSISVAGTTVSYNGGHLSRWSQLSTQQRDPALLKGTVLSNLDEMCEWLDADGNPLPNEQLNRMKVSDVEGDPNVAGVFVNWDNDDQANPYDMNIAMTGDMIIRIAAGIVVQKGMLLMSAGDGTAKPQGDDIVRSKTIAKVTSNHVTCTYPDGSYCVPCVLMAC